MYERVLVATDGSESADRAADHAVDLARQYGATLHVLAVAETRIAYDSDIVDPETVRERQRERCETAVAAVVDRAREADVAVETDVRRGVPGEEILDAIAAWDVDVVVMGAKGRSALQTVLLGSATETVIAGTAVPVLVVGKP